MKRYVLSRPLYEVTDGFVASSVASLAIFALLPVLEPMIDLLTGYEAVPRDNRATHQLSEGPRL
jgi:hypothetical protein